jgi:hypothetical protein
MLSINDVRKEKYYLVGNKGEKYFLNLQLFINAYAKNKKINEVLFNSEYDVRDCVELKYSEEFRIHISLVQNAKGILVLGTSSRWDSISGKALPESVMALTFNRITTQDGIGELTGNGIGIGWFELTAKGGALRESLVVSLKKVISSHASFFPPSQDNTSVACKIMLYYVGRPGGRPDVQNELYNILLCHGGEADLHSNMERISKLVAGKQKSVVAMAYDTSKISTLKSSGEVNVRVCK